MNLYLIDLYLQIPSHSTQDKNPSAKQEHPDVHPHFKLTEMSLLGAP